MSFSPSRNALELLDRRSFLRHTGTALGSMALAHLLARDQLLANENPIRPTIDPSQPHAPRAPHFEAKAKNVLVIFCSGACSHLDTWDYKPELIKHHGKPMPGADKLITFQGENGNLVQSPWAFKPR